MIGDQMGTARLPARGVRRGSFEMTAANLAVPDRPTDGLDITRDSLGRKARGGFTLARTTGLVAALTAIELVLAWQPTWRMWAWFATLGFAGLGAILCLVAGQRHERFHVVWYAAAGGCLSLLLGFLSRGLQDYELGRGPIALGHDDSGFQGAVLFFLVAALGLMRGESAWLRRAKLGLDVAILVIAPLVAGLVLSELWELTPEQERLRSAALLYATSYAAMCYAFLVATRRVPFAQPGSAAGTLTLAALALGAAAVCHAIRLALPAYDEFRVGQSFWALGAGLAALAGVRASTGSAYGPRDALSREVGEDSRLRLIPAALAGLVIAAIAAQQAGAREPPSGALFFGTSSLFWLIVSRLLVTLAENRRLVRGVHTAERSQMALRDLGAALNSSLDPERVWQHVCRMGQTVLRADSTVLWLVDRPAHELVAVEVAGNRREELIRRRLSLDDRTSLAVRVARTRSPELVRQAAEAKRSHPLLTVLRASQCLLAVPLQRGQHSFGVLVFSHTRDAAAFRPEDVARGEVLANQAAVALRNAELFQYVSRGFDEMSALYEYARACDGTASSEDIARELLVALQSKVDFQEATVLLADSGMLVSARGLVMRRMPGQAEPSWDVPPARISPLASRAFRLREAVRAVAGDADFKTRHPQSVVHLAVPFFLRDHALGVVEMESSQATAFGERDERLIAALARHTALAIDNLRLEEDTREVANLKKLDRMKTELLGTVSHELRTPLAAIKGYATTLLEHDRMKAGLRREFLTVIDSESERLEDLINNLLDMSRLEAGVLKVDPAPVKLGRVVQTVVKRAQRLTREHHLVVEWRKDPWVMADVPRVLQVLTNLLNNAVKYSPDGGEIRVVGWEENGMLKIAVHDAGVGIPPRELDKIFDRFHRIEGDMARRVSGTGLGLAICRGLVEAHGGRIWVESEPDAGSTFTFSIPVCDPVVS
jgi:signal transduction histidine kinase